MGEVRAKIKLTNATDEVMAQMSRGKRAKVRQLEIEGVIDTGAVSLILPSHVANKLGLLRMGKQVAQYADGRQDEVDVTSPVFVEVMGRRTTEEAMVLGDEVLIGQTVLEKIDLLVNSRDQKLIPNPAHPNQPIQKVRGLSRPMSLARRGKKN
ncbi:MAG: clan AA aspartic protease [Blastocatellia bacterium]